MAYALFPRIPLAYRAFPAPTNAPQRRFLWSSIRAILIGSPKYELFNPTKGRWLWGEEHHVALHTRPFNISALKAVAAEALGVAHWRVRLNKFSEGGTSKIILARGGGRRVIIKLPDPVLPAGVVIASEVAAMEFARTELDIPTPKVLGWNCDAGGPVEAEYIMMEEAEEDMACVRWPELKFEGKANVLKEILEVDKKLLRSSELFRDVGYGSLYLTEDAEKLGFKKVFKMNAGRNPGRFCLGPLTDQHFWADSTADIDRGPWLTPQAYLTSIVDSSLHHLHLRGPPTAKTRPFILNIGLEEDKIYPTKFTTELLQRFRFLIPGLVHPTLSAPTLWHPDLSYFNIFITPSGIITSIIDWQYTHVLPLFLQADIPSLLRREQRNPEATPDPVSPLGIDLVEEDDEVVQRRLEISAMSMLYVTRLCEASGELSDELWEVLNRKRIAMSRTLGVSLATQTFETAGETLLFWSLLIRIVREWGKIAPGTECPVTLSQEEISKWKEDGGYHNGWLDLLDMYEMPRGTNARVSVQDFEAEKKKIKDFVKNMLGSFEDDETDVRRERVIRHVKSWKLTDWNGGDGWIDTPDEKSKSEPSTN